MKLSPALEFEKLREDAESWNKIFLHKDGKFFRAYEWSAWLIKTVVCTEEFHYGRYVDDAYVVSCDKERMKAIVPEIQSFLGMSLGLELHMGKLSVKDAEYGTEFLGAFVKPYRIYASNACLHRMERNIGNMDMKDSGSVYRSVNSFLGVLSHYKTYRIRRRLFLRGRFLRMATFNRDITVMNKPYNYKEI